MSRELMQDFIQDGKTFMIIDREQGFDSSELSRTQTGMMLSSRIQGVLQLHLHELNMKSQLRYDITGKRMLKHCLQSETIGIAEYLGLLLQLVSTLEDSGPYMLSLPNYILDEDYMFIEGALQAGRLYIAYVPVVEALSDLTVQEHIAQLASQWITAVRELQGNIVQQILKYCQEGSFTLDGLKQLLLLQLTNDHSKLMKERQEEAAQAVHSPRPGDRDWSYALGASSVDSVTQSKNNSVYSNPDTVYEEWANKPTAVKRHHNNESAQAGVQERNGFGLRNDPQGKGNASRHVHADAFKPTQGIGGVAPSNAIDSNRKEAKSSSSLFSSQRKKKAVTDQSSGTQLDHSLDEELKKLPSTYRTYLLAGGALLIAMIWRYGYVEHENDVMLYGCSALTITVILTIYLVLKGKITMGTKGKSGVEEEHIQSNRSTRGRKLGNLSPKEEQMSGQEQWRWNKEDASSGAAPFTQSSQYNQGNYGDLSQHSDSNPSQKEVLQRERSIAELFGSFAHGASSVSSKSTDPDFRAESVAYPSSDMRMERQPEEQPFSWGKGRETTATERSTLSYAGSTNEDAQGGANRQRQVYGNAPTETLSSHMATVVLDENDAMSHGANHIHEFSGYLERRDKEGRQGEPIRLRKGNFIIGRAEDGVHYHEPSVGTSRNHVELEVRNGQVFIKDLSSRNGTQLQGESLVPYKSYPMQDGDRFTVARAEYTLRLNG